MLALSRAVSVFRYDPGTLRRWKTVRIYRRIAGGVHWVHVHPPGRRKILGAKFTEERCKCTLRQSNSPISWGNWGISGRRKRLFR